MTIAYGYIRVSGDEQADRGLPVAGQRQALEDYATQHGLDLERILVDEARSGGNDRREQFQLLMELAHRKPPACQVILLWSWARFARNQNDALYWKASLRRQGITITDVSGETPSVDGFENVIESLIHWKDEQKLKEISSQARRGQQALVRLGYMPGSKVPRGFRAQEEEIVLEGRTRTVRRWVPDPATWPIARRAWELRLEGASYARIQAECPLYHSAGCWTTFFANPIYKGEHYVGGTLMEVEPLVTPEEWEQVNANRLPPRGGAERRRRGGPFVLSGLLRCARCGAPLNGDYTGAGMRNDGHARKAVAYYVCLSRKRRQGCDLPRWQARALERAVIEALFREVLTPEALTRELALIHARRLAEEPAIAARIEGLASELEALEAAMARLVDAIEQGASVTLAKRLREREAEHAAKSRELRAARQLLEGRTVDYDLDALRAALQEALEAGPDEPSRLALRSLVAEVLVDAEAVTVRYVPPFGAATGLQ